MPVQPLSAVEMAAWHGLIRAHAATLRTLSVELEAEHGLSLPAYEVLAHLSEAPGQQLRMTELTECASLTPSGLTRLIDKLVAEALVARVRCVEDGRVVYAVLTDGGGQRLEQAYPTHLRGVREHVIDRLSKAEVAALATATAKLVASRDAPGACEGA